MHENEGLLCFVSMDATRLVFWCGELGKGMYDTKIAVGRVGKIRHILDDLHR